MRPLPSGFVTFMFTDIEGSTRLHRALGDRYAALIAEHDALLMGAVHEHAGRVVKSMGDGMFAVFGDPQKAVLAAAEIQRATAEHVWPDLSPVRVRIGMHAGHAEPTGRDYVSLAVHKAARVMGAAFGQQILITDELAAAVPTEGDLSIRSLGAFRLKDFDEPIVLHQVNAAGRSPVSESVRAAAYENSNIPTVRTSFIGRGYEMRELTRMVTTGAPLVTVVGFGGVGKTRLSFEVAKAAAPSFADGCCLLSLAETTPGAVDDHVMNALKVGQAAGLSARSTVIEVLRERNVLIVMDNCEHVIDDAASLVADLLRACPQLVVLATSREPLRLSTEVEWRLEPLPTAERGGEAAELFRQRARAHLTSSDSSPAEADPHLVVAICERLDGIPLAIELAAARLRELSLSELAAHLADNLPALSSDLRDLDYRQQTLRRLVEWSCDLLDPASRRVWQRIAVFRGAMSKDAVSAVVEPADRHDVPAYLAELVEKSLIVETTDAQHPYRLLVPVREVAGDLLRASGAERAACDRHFEYEHALAAKISNGIDGPDGISWLAEANASYDDFIAAFDHVRRHGRIDDVARLITELFRYFLMTGKLSEGRSWLDVAMAATEPRLLGLVASQAGTLALSQGDIAEAVQLCKAGLARLLEASAGGDLALARLRLGNALAEAGETDESQNLLAAAAQSDVPEAIRGAASKGLGIVALTRGDLDAAEQHFRDARSLAQSHGSVRGAAIAQGNLARVLLVRGHHDEAETLLLEALETFQTLERSSLPIACELLGQLHRERGDSEVSTVWFDRARAAAREIGDRAVLKRLESA